MQVDTTMWAVFGAIVAASLIIDLVTHRGEHSSSRRAAIAWSAVWISVALVFAAWIAIRLGRGQAEDFLSAYLMEKSLSIDNLFVFLVVFDRLRVRPADQHRVLFWGILGALVFRGIFIAAGSAVISRWHEVIYVLGVLLVVTGVNTVRAQDSHDGDTRILRFLRAKLGMGSTFLVALLTIELTDVLFAIDSVPAVFAITDDPFIVYTSNVFAMLGLRALFLVLSGALARLHHLKYALAAILVLAGVKMLVSGFYHPPHYVSLLAIVTIVGVAVVTSLRGSNKR
jgi:tellurite resistance protein TerC